MTRMSIKVKLMMVMANGTVIKGSKAVNTYNPTAMESYTATDAISDLMEHAHCFMANCDDCIGYTIIDAKTKEAIAKGDMDSIEFNMDYISNTTITVKHTHGASVMDTSTTR